jgi:hypothetical protein
MALIGNDAAEDRETQETQETLASRITMAFDSWSLISCGLSDLLALDAIETGLVNLTSDAVRFSCDAWRRYY